MGGGIYLTIPDMPGCVDITESICVGGGIYLTIPDMPGCIDITEGICVRLWRVRKILWVTLR